uniref:Coiled-coil domain containing 12 n=1 Tax=Lates calcarifer TaxID=8187 RepID=A0A4W6DN43_LATCA
MLIRRVHRNKEGHYTRPRPDIRRAAVQGLQMVFYAPYSLMEYICLHCHLLDCPNSVGSGMRELAMYCFPLRALKVRFAVLCISVLRELKLRNYTPEDEELKERQVPKAKPASVEDKVKDQLEAANPEPIIEEVDLANLAPRKPDWDLKRDVAKKLEKLERRTQRAIAELIRDRLRGSEEELAGAVGAVGAEEGDSD